MKKIIIVLTSIIFVAAILFGCGRAKAPEGFNEELWKDSIKYSDILYKHYKDKTNFSDEEKQILDDYESKYSTNFKLTDDEQDVVTVLVDLRFKTNMYLACIKENDKNGIEKYKKDIENGFKFISEIIK